MSRQKLPLGEAGLLSRANARIYCGCLGEERFDREVGPHVTPKLLGGEKFYIRAQLDAWIGIEGRRRPSYAEVNNWIDRQCDDHFQGTGRPQEDR